MIVTSIRCFMNVLTQLWSAEQLLNANYYICDLEGPSNIASFTSEVNKYGDQYEEKPVTTVAKLIDSCKYNIGYSRVLDPETYKTRFLMGQYGDCTSAFDVFVNHLNNVETMIEVYNFIFNKRLGGNGIQILVFFDDDNLLEYGNIICQYLAKNFGVDIIFIDPQYRPNCRGCVEYKGDVEFATKNIHDLRDVKLLNDFNRAISISDMNSSNSNIMVFLSDFNFNDLIYLYNLLYPGDPLPPGNYTEDYLRQILIERALASSECGKSLYSILPNINIFNTKLFDEQYQLYEQETEQDEYYQH